MKSPDKRTSGIGSGIARPTRKDDGFVSKIGRPTSVAKTQQNNFMSTQPAQH